MASYFHRIPGLSRILGNTSFDTPVDLPLPNLTVYNSKIDNVASLDKALALDLSKMAKLIKEKETMFSNEASFIHNRIGWALNDYTPKLIFGLPSMTTLLSLVTTGIAGYGLFKVNKLAMLVYQLSKMPHLTESIPIKVQPFQRFASQSTQSPIVICKASSMASSEILWFCITGLCVVLGIIAIIRATLHLLVKFVNSKECYLIIEITNGKDCVKIPVKQLHNCPMNYVAQSCNTIDNVNLSNLWSFDPHIMIDWQSFQLLDVELDEIVVIPNKICVKMYQRLLLTRITKVHYKCHLFIEHLNLAFPLKVNEVQTIPQPEPIQQIANAPASY